MKHRWIYSSKLFSTSFQAGVWETRISEDWWLKEYRSPKEVEVYQTQAGRYGVRYIW